jgi:hypothetical protein
MSAVMGGSASSTLHDTVVRWNRTPEGEWLCIIKKGDSYNWDDYYAPPNCSIKNGGIQSLDQA